MGEGVERLVDVAQTMADGLVGEGDEAREERAGLTGDPTPGTRWSSARRQIKTAVRSSLDTATRTSVGTISPTGTTSRSCSILDAALSDKVDRDNGHGRLEYDGVAIRTGGHPAQVKFVVIVQYTRKTTDQKYDAGRGQKIGVINAFCRNQPHNKCPAWVNQ
ncbi:hypothetical protein [Streptomyces sp. NPDC001500]